VAVRGARAAGGETHCGLPSSGGAREFWSFVSAFAKGLGESGYTDGHNVTIEYRWAEGHYDRLPALVADLTRRPVAAICAAYLPAALAAKAATTTIPIVFVIGSDPVEVGLVATLGRPGGNVTGVTQFTNALIAKRLELLRELVPGVALVGVLMNTDNPNVEINTRDLQLAAHTIGQQILIVGASREHGFDAAFTALAKQKAGALFISPDAFFQSRRVEIAILAARHAIPAISSTREFAESGGLISYGASQIWASEQAGVYMGRIVKGEKASDLPVVQPTKFELVINRRTAKTLGLDVPTTLLARADEVIE
jgi:putative tryptophan/tyrosine transport system substrate-binding protein